MKMTQEEIEVLLLTVKCLINLHKELKINPPKNYEDYLKELDNLQQSSFDILKKARKNNIIIPKEDRLLLYEIIKD